MKLVIKTARYAVIDEVLPEPLFQDTWKTLADERFSQKNVTIDWSKTWSFEGQPGYSSSAVIYRQAEPNTYQEVLGQVFLEITKHLPEIIDKDWQDLRIHTQMFGRGVKINGHYDLHSAGSFTFYAHPRWDCNWGGELIIPEVPSFSEGQDKPPQSLDRSWENKFLEVGIGQVITPKPNRCVLTGPGVFHYTNRVDPDAGDALRISIVGFLLKEKK